MNSRRQFIEHIGIAVAGGTLGDTVDWLMGIPVETHHLLLVSSWQTINIGDIAHTPGVLHILEERLPDVKVTLMGLDMRDGVRQMIQTRFPKVKIIENENESDVADAFEQCDFLLHGSGPFLVGRRQVKQWKDETGKPYGVYGITFTEHNELETMAALLTAAEFVFFRDSVSLAFAKSIGVNCPIMDFGPDGAFAVDLRNDMAAERFLKDHNLEVEKFLCVIPRYRYTPNWKIPSKNRAFNPEKDARNQEMKEHDHAPLRAAIEAVVKETDLKILICAEDVTQVAIGKEMLYDPLPDSIKEQVVWRDTFWLTDEALSVYVRSLGMFGLEMHSPIMCIGNGIPALVGRFEEQTSKGYMWKDIGLEDWLFDMDKPEDVARLAPTVLALARDSESARRKAMKAKKHVIQKQKETMKVLATAMVD